MSLVEPGARIFISSSSPIILSLKMNVNIACRSRNLCHKCDHFEGLKLHPCCTLLFAGLRRTSRRLSFQSLNLWQEFKKYKRSIRDVSALWSSPMPLQGAQSSNPPRRFIERLFPAHAKPLRMIRHPQEQADRAILTSTSPRKPGDQTRDVR